MVKELKTGEMWAKQFGIRMMDEDGWNPRSTYYTVAISEEDFLQRITLCTTQLPYTKELEDKINHLNKTNEIFGKDDVPTIIESTPEAKEAFGECYGAHSITLDQDHLRALCCGKTIATKINMREYTVFIKLI